MKLSSVPARFARFLPILPLSAVLWIAHAGLAFAADRQPLVFCAGPTHSPAVSRELYGPLVAYLEQATGRKIDLQTSPNFVAYSNRVQRGDYDILFHGPHFAGWRLERFGSQ